MMRRRTRVKKRTTMRRARSGTGSKTEGVGRKEKGEAGDIDISSYIN